MKNQNITAVIYAYNEEKNIRACIESAKLLDRAIFVVDLQSTDHTSDLAKKMGVNVFSYPFSNYVEPAREFGIRQAKTDWVLILDADERMTKDLASEVLKRAIVLSDSEWIQDDKFTYYKIPRKNIFGNFRWLKYGGWWPDYQIRLINKKYFKSWPKEIPSSPEIDGNFAFLHNPIIHYFHGDLGTMLKKTITFEDIEADLLLKAGKQVKTLTFFRKFLGELYRRLIKNFGFLDGEIGIIESIYQAFSKTITYLFLYEKRFKKKESSSLRPLP